MKSQDAFVLTPQVVLALGLALRDIRTVHDKGNLYRSGTSLPQHIWFSPLKISDQERIFTLVDVVHKAFQIAQEKLNLLIESSGPKPPPVQTRSPSPPTTGSRGTASKKRTIGQAEDQGVAAEEDDGEDNESERPRKKPKPSNRVAKLPLKPTRRSTRNKA
jgi:hypothetical protein